VKLKVHVKIFPSANKLIFVCLHINTKYQKNNLLKYIYLLFLFSRVRPNIDFIFCVIALFLTENPISL